MLATISREELQQKMAGCEPFLLVETLPAMIYMNGHLPGAINLPPDQVKATAYQVLPDLTADIVLYCASPT